MAHPTPGVPSALLAAISIDLDGLDCYHSIHDLPPHQGRDLVYTFALDRYLALLAEVGAPSTIFVITRCLDTDPQVVSSLRGAVEHGHELASHTHHHPYDLGRLGAREVAAELDLAADRLNTHFGRHPVGFRTPGYNVSETILAALEARGYRYDSSVFPCPPYYLAKGLAMLALRAVGRRSGSSATDPRALLAPVQPYRPRRDRFYRRAPPEHARRLWELPMCVLPGLRLPVIGTTLALFGGGRFRSVYPWLRTRQPMLNLEFHGIDFLGPDDSGVSPELLARQPDLRVPLPDKLQSYRDALSAIREDYTFVTLEGMTAALEQRELEAGEGAG